MAMVTTAGRWRMVIIAMPQETAEAPVSIEVAHHHPVCDGATSSVTCPLVDTVA